MTGPERRSAGGPEQAAFIALGSNLGDRERNIWRAVDALAEHPHIRVIAVSTLKETAPVGPVPDQPDFVNAVARIETKLRPEELLECLLELERRMGRLRGPKGGPRLIDLDILYYGEDKVESESLRIPHPEIGNRNFWRDGLRELGRTPS